MQKLTDNYIPLNDEFLSDFFVLSVLIAHLIS